MKGNKVVLIGLDAMTLDMVDCFVQEGVMPNMEKLMENGFVTEAISSMPPATSVNWTTIATGAHAGTHGVTVMNFLEPGKFFTGTPRSAFYSNLCLAEKIYETAEKHGKRVILLKYPTSWPPTIKNGVQVDGFGDPGENVHDIAPRLCFATYPLKRTLPRRYIADYVVEVKPAKGWTGLRDGEYFEAVLKFNLVRGGQASLYALLDRGRRTLTLCQGRDARKPLAVLREGEWSDWLETEFKLDSGEKVIGVFKAKLMELSEDCRRFRLYTNRIMSKYGWTYPASLAEELYKACGPYQELSAIVGPYNSGWVDEKTVLEETEYQAKWLGKAARYLMTHYRWDLMMTQWHGIDHMGHLFLGGIDPKCIYYDRLYEKICMKAMKKTYALADKFIGDILTCIDENTVICVVSDHGMIGVRTRGININKILQDYGINEPGKWRARRYDESYIVINLEGREEDGCVSIEEYENLRSRIIKILEDVRDPETEERVLQIVLKKEDAAIFGMYGDRVGDIIFLLKTEYSRPISKVKVGEQVLAERGLYEYTRGEHHAFFPVATKGVGSILATAVFYGPGIRKVVRRNRPIQLIDIAPTLAHILGINVPSKSEGSILFEMFE